VKDVALASVCGTQAETTIVAQGWLHPFQLPPKCITSFENVVQALPSDCVPLGRTSSLGETSLRAVTAVSCRCTARTATCLEHGVTWCWWMSRTFAAMGARWMKVSSHGPSASGASVDSQSIRKCASAPIMCATALMT
jgi:hypothetical protein